MSPGDRSSNDALMPTTAVPRSAMTHAGWLGGAPRIQAQLDRSRAALFRERAGVSLLPFAGVVVYWWLATGLIFAMQRDGVTRAIGMAASTALGALGVWMIVRTREQATPAGARAGFLGGALLWGWLSVALYGGWIVGPAELQVAVPAAAPTLARALQAAHSIGYHEGMSLLFLVGTWWVTRRSANRMAFWSLFTFWAVQLTAKLNVFLGVENPGGRFLPERLWFLESYFGPPHHGVLLPLTLAVLLMASLAGALVWVRHPRPYLRQSGALLTTLLLLAVLEHLLLAISVDVPLWDSFLRSRGY